MCIPLNWFLALNVDSNKYFFKIHSFLFDYNWRFAMKTSQRLNSSVNFFDLLNSNMTRRQTYGHTKHKYIRRKKRVKLGINFRKQGNKNHLLVTATLKYTHPL